MIENKQWQIWISEDRPWEPPDRLYNATIYKSKAQAEEIALFLNEQYARHFDHFYVKEVEKGEEKK